MISAWYISPRRVIKKKFQRLALQIKKHIDRYRSSFVLLIGIVMLAIVISAIYRYFLWSTIRQVKHIQLDTVSMSCYPDPYLHIQIASALSWSNMRMIKVGNYPSSYQDLQKKYPLLWDLSIDRNEKVYQVWYTCIKPTMVWKIEKKTIASRSGRMLAISDTNPLIWGVMVWHLPNYITGSNFDSLYHVIGEHQIQNVMSIIQKLFWPLQQTYLIGSDKIEIITIDGKYITLSMSQNIWAQHEAISRLQKHYFEYRNITHIDVSNLHHIVVKK